MSVAISLSHDLILWYPILHSSHSHGQRWLGFFIAVSAFWPDLDHFAATEYEWCLVTTSDGDRIFCRPSGIISVTSMGSPISVDR